MDFGGSEAIGDCWPRGQELAQERFHVGGPVGGVIAA
jgi:hypothetical protein